MKKLLFLSLLGIGVACGGPLAMTNAPMAINASPEEVKNCEHMGQVRSDSRQMGSADRTTVLRQDAYAKGATHVIVQDDTGAQTFGGEKYGQMYKCAPGQAGGGGAADAGHD